MDSDPSSSVAASVPAPPDSVAPSKTDSESRRDRLVDRARPYLYPALTIVATAVVFLGQLVEDAD